MKHKFDYSIETLDKINGVRTLDEIKYEPMLFGADFEYAMKNGGKLTKQLLNKLWGNDIFWKQYIVPLVANNVSPKQKKYDIVIDTRVTMVMEGQFPSIPGWHTDDVERTNGQPDFTKNNNRVQHFMCLLSTVPDCTCTEFVVDRPEFEFDSKSKVYNQLDKKVNKGNYKTKFIKEGEIVRFDQNAIHRASPCTKPGWRYFFRLSITHRKPWNEIRQQVQVYQPMKDVGW